MHTGTCNAVHTGIWVGTYSWSEGSSLFLLLLTCTHKSHLTLPLPSSAQVLLSACPALLVRPDSSGCTPLHHASAASSPELLHLLLSYKTPKGVTPVDVDVNSEDCYQRTPLHCAAARNRPMNAKVCEQPHRQALCTSISKLENFFPP